MIKNPPASAGDVRCWFDPWVGKIPWRRAWQPDPVFLPGESPGRRSLAGYSPSGCKEWDMTEATEQTRLLNEWEGTHGNISTDRGPGPDRFEQDTPPGLCGESRQWGRAGGETHQGCCRKAVEVTVTRAGGQQ